MDFEGLEEVIAYEGKQFVTDLEGPVTRNRNALELCERFIEGGGRFFAQLGRYDRVLAEILHRPGFKAGDRLRLILPFLKAYGASDHNVLEFSRTGLLVLPGAEKTMRYVQEIMACFMVSSAYEHYVSVASERLGFPFDNAFCTRISLDSVKMEEWEARTLRNLAQEVVALPLLEIPSGARSIGAFSSKDQSTIQRLDDIFWTEATDLPSFRLVMETSPIGAEEKAGAVMDVCKKTGVGVEDTMYVGDGTTDSQALRLVRKGGGFSLAFNGNHEAVREADVAVMSGNTVVTSVLAEAFYKGGKDAVLDLADNWTLEGIRRSGTVHDYLVKELERTFPGGLPNLARVNASNVAEITRSSVTFRQTVRGERT